MKDDNFLKFKNFLCISIFYFLTLSLHADSKLYDSYLLSKIKFSQNTCEEKMKYKRCKSTLISSVFYFESEFKKISELDEILIENIYIENIEYAIIFPYLFKKTCILITYCRKN